MNKNSIDRLLHTLVPFMVMAMLQRLLLLIFGHVGFSGQLAELCAFLPASCTAIVLFRLKTYHIYKEDEHSEVKPLVKKPPVQCALRVVLTVAVMILAMYATSAFMNGMSFSAVQTAELSVLSVISSVVLHPLVEEYLFRHLFYGELRLLNPIFGCMMQAVMFAIVHNSVDSMIYALSGGFILAVLYEQTGRITCAAVAHAVINLRSLLYLTLLSGYANITQIADMTFVILGGIAFLVLAVLDGRRMAAYSEGEGEGETEESDGADDE